MRSTSFTIRSVSSQIRRVRARSSSPTAVSSSWAAPRMPDSGFLISWASIAASAETERAAPRWVSCLSILSAIVRSCSKTTVPACPSGIGATWMSTTRSKPRRGLPRSTRYSITAEPRLATWSTRASRGDAKGTRSASLCRVIMARLISKKVSAATLTSTTLPSGATARMGCGNPFSTGAAFVASDRLALASGDGTGRSVTPPGPGLDGTRRPRRRPGGGSAPPARRSW